MYKCKYFKIQELVSPCVFEKFGEKAWMFFNEDVLKDLDYIREVWGKPIVINSYAKGLKQCGLRCNLDDLVRSKKAVYCSAHLMGKGFDLHTDGNKGLYELVMSLVKTRKLKAFKRLENFNKTLTWVHIDAFRADGAVVF